MDREIITQAKNLIMNGYSHHDGSMLRMLGYNNPEVLTAMESIFNHVIMIRFYDLSNAVVKYYEKHPKPPMTLSEIRSCMYETSQLMLCDGRGLSHILDSEEIEYATNYLIFEVEENE